MGFCEINGAMCLNLEIENLGGGVPGNAADDRGFSIGGMPGVFGLGAN